MPYPRIVSHLPIRHTPLLSLQAPKCFYLRVRHLAPLHHTLPFKPHELLPPRRNGDMDTSCILYIYTPNLPPCQHRMPGKWMQCPKPGNIHESNAYNIARRFPCPPVRRVYFSAVFPHPASTCGTHLSQACLLYTSPSPRDLSTSRMPSSA